MSGEFAALWDEHPVAGTYCDAAKHIDHPRAGLIELRGENLLDPDRSQLLTVFTAEPGSASRQRLEQLALLSRTGIPCGGSAAGQVLMCISSSGAASAAGCAVRRATTTVAAAALAVNARARTSGRSSVWLV